MTNSNDNNDCDGSSRGWCGKDGCTVCHKTSDNYVNFSLITETTEDLRDENCYLRNLLNIESGEVDSLQKEVESLKDKLAQAQASLDAAEDIFERQEQETHRNQTSQFREFKKENKFHNKKSWKRMVDECLQKIK